MSDRLRKIFDSKTAVEAFKDWCRLEPTEERCGLFVEHDAAVSFMPCVNIALDKKNSFMIHPKDFVDMAETGEVIGIGHSHVIGTSEPSNADRVNCTNCQLPFIIYQPEANTAHWLEPEPMPVPLEGRNWVLGVSDCYTLARDYYKSQGLELKDYVRNSLEDLYKHTLFIDHYAENGFVEVHDTPRVHDALLIQVMSDVANHVAVMLDNGLILHHLQSSLSRKEPYGGYWRRHTVKVLRHQKWL